MSKDVKLNFPPAPNSQYQNLDNHPRPSFVYSIEADFTSLRHPENDEGGRSGVSHHRQICLFCLRFSLLLAINYAFLLSSSLCWVSHLEQN